MKRVVMIPDDVQEKKFVLRDTYEGYGINEEMCPAGYLVHQSYMISDGKTQIVSFSFNQICKDELLGAIDAFKETGKYGLNAFKRSFGYIIHPSGNPI